MNLESLSTQIHPEFFEVATIVKAAGLRPGIVGGWVRDYLRNGDVSLDYDIELRLLDSETEDDLLTRYQQLQLSLQQKFNAEILAYNVTHFKLNELDFELTLPRLEEFDVKAGHSNFTAKFIADLDYTKGFLRRDFTINAMMIEYTDSFRFIDPLNGYADLQQGLLRPTSPQFEKDPVRFLRGIRFAIKYNFVLDPIVTEKIKAFNINHFTHHYLKLEAYKSKKPFQFFNELWKNLGEDYSIDMTELARDYQKEFFTDKVEDFIYNAWFLSKLVRKELCRVLQLKNTSVVEAPIKFKSILTLDDDNNEVMDKYLRTYKTLTQFCPKIIDFYFQQSYIDLDSKGLEKIDRLKIDVDDIDNKLRAAYVLKERVRWYFENQTD